MKRVYALVNDPKCIEHILQFNNFLGIFWVDDISELHFGIFVLLQVIAHDHSHEAEYDVNIQLILFLYENLIDNELRS